MCHAPFVSLREKQGKGLFQEALLCKKGRVVGYERMAYRWILFGGNMLLIACFGFWEHVSGCYL